MNITDRTGTSEALFENEERFRQLAENIAEVFWLTDPFKRQMIYVSPAYSRIWGRDCSTLYTNPQAFLDAILPEDQHLVYDSFKRQKKGEAVEIEYRIRRPDGSLRWIRSRGFPVLDNEGNVWRIAGISEDITKYKLAEEAFRETQKLLISILDHAPMPMYVVSAAGRYELVNRAWEKFTQLNREAAIGRTIDQVFPTETTRHFAEVNECVLTSSSPIVTEEFVDLPEKRHFFHTVKFPIRDDDGRVRSVAGISVDITERKQAEEKLRIYHEHMVQLASELSTIEEYERRRIASDLHDHIGQSLAIAKIKLGALRERAGGTDLQRAIDQIRALVDQSIQYTRSLTFELGMPVLYELGLDAALEWLAEHIQEQHHLPVEIESDGADRKIGDELQLLLFKAARELLMNVVKHAKANSAIICVASAGNHTRITVADDGVGFDQAKTDYLSGKTCGFGLFSIRERLKLAGGSIDVDSGPDRGAVVTVILPHAGCNGSGDKADQACP